MGILAYETFIGWNVLRPGARAMGSVTLLLRILNRPATRAMGHRSAGQMKKPCTKCHVGIKSKIVFLAELPAARVLLECLRTTREKCNLFRFSR